MDMITLLFLKIRETANFTIKDALDALHSSRFTILYYLDKLQKKGYLTVKIEKIENRGRPNKKYYFTEKAIIYCKSLLNFEK